MLARAAGQGWPGSLGRVSEPHPTAYPFDARPLVEPGVAAGPGVLVELEWDQQVVLGVADQVLHDALGLRVRGMTEVGPEPVVAGEPDVVRCRHHDIGDHVALQTRHPVREHDLRNPAELLEALRQQPQRGGLLLIGSEADEPEPRPSEHCAEHVHLPAGQDLLAPVDGQHLAR